MSGDEDRREAGVEGIEPPGCASATLRRRDDSPRDDFRNAFLPRRGPHPDGSPRFLVRLRSSLRLGSRPSSQSANPPNARLPDPLTPISSPNFVPAFYSRTSSTLRSL